MDRMNPDDRFEAIMVASLAAAAACTYTLVTRSQIAERAGVSPALVSHYLGSMNEARTMIMEYAVTWKDEQILAQGLAAGDPVAHAAPIKLKRRATRHLLEG